MNKKFFLSPLCTKWLETQTYVRKLSAHTLKAYETDFKIFQNFFNDYFGEPFTFDHFQTLTITDLRAFVANRHHQKITPRSTARCLAALRSFAKYLIQEKLIEDHPLLAFKLGKIHKKMPRPLSIDQVLSLIHNVKDGDEVITKTAQPQWIGLRNQALMMLLYSVGLRISEALNLKRTDFDRSFLMITGKRNKMRQVPLLDNVRDAIFTYLAQCPYSIEEKDPIFKTIRGKNMQQAAAQLILRQYRRFYGLPETVTPHALRHTCATHLLEGNADLRSIQELLGHATLSTTQLYTDVAEQRIKESFKKAHPRD